MNRLGVVAGALALAFALGGLIIGNWRVAATEAAHRDAIAEWQDRVATATETAARKEAERLAVEAERDLLARELEDAARQDPDADRTAIGADSVRRLNAR